MICLWICPFLCSIADLKNEPGFEERDDEFSRYDVDHVCGLFVGNSGIVRCAFPDVLAQLKVNPQMHGKKCTPT